MVTKVNVETVVSEKAVHVSKMAKGDYGVIASWPISSYNGQLVCRAYTENDNDILLVSINNPTQTWRISVNSDYDMRVFLVKEIKVSYKL